MTNLSSLNPANPDDRSGHRMTALERRSALSLASLFALRMLGLFLVMPVFALEARKLPGGDDAALVGLAMGVYGLTQGLLQIPFGVASDRFGRKRVMVLGLLIFCVGSALAALATDVQWLAVARAVQGAGAISAAVSALLADQTRDAVRTKAMALVGASIGLVFALSLVLSPVLNAWWGLRGLFALTCVLAAAGIAVVGWWVPPEPAGHVDAAGIRLGAGLRAVLANSALLRLNAGVFVLHAIQLAMWVAIPGMLVAAGLPKDAHWQAYLPALLGSFVLMGGVLFPLERRGHLRAVLLGSIALLVAVELGLAWLAGAAAGVVPIALLLFAFFCGFNVLEASQPSLASRLAPAQLRGTALGVYNTLQSLGLFVGGAAGGWLVRQAGNTGLFAVCALAAAAWLVIAWPMAVPRPAAATGRSGT